ncbi:MAG: hypothetical protein AAGL29_00995 [Bacteroidota bacterium]
MKSFQLFFILPLLSSPTLAQQEVPSVLDSTLHYVFHNNYWINLHHFLYQKASGSQLSKLQQDGNEMLVIGEKPVEESLSVQQRSSLDSAIGYYKRKMIQKSLLRGLGYERYWLQKQVGSKAIKDSTVSQEFVDVLNAVSNTYQETYWPVHKKHNKEILEHQISNIRQLEKRIIARMERLSLTPWPSKKKVRVDLTAYANYAGAYTPTRPIFNVLVSTVDPNSLGPDFLETIFHEGSHLLFRYESVWRDSIFQTFESGDYKMKFPRHLWHVSLFYLCGQVCKEEFIQIGVKDYEMTLLRRNIFKTYQSPELFAALDEYVQNNHTLYATTKQLLGILESKAHQ